MPLNEADTCRRYVVPKLQAAGWETEPHRINEQVTFTDGRIIVAGRGGRRCRSQAVLRHSGQGLQAASRSATTQEIAVHRAVQAVLQGRRRIPNIYVYTSKLMLRRHGFQRRVL
jgi:hypothetical protein